MPDISSLTAVDETVADGDILALHNISKGANLKDQGLTITKLRDDAFLTRSNTWTLQQIFNSGVRSGATGSIADDGFLAIAMVGFPCAIWLTPGSASTPAFIVSMRSNGVAPVVLVSSSAVAVTTGAMTGTRGSDNAITVSVHTDNNFYIENRLGFSISYTYVELS